MVVVVMVQVTSLAEDQREEFHDIMDWCGCTLSVTDCLVIYKDK